MLKNRSVYVDDNQMCVYAKTSAGKSTSGNMETSTVAPSYYAQNNEDTFERRECFATNCLSHLQTTFKHFYKRLHLENCSRIEKWRTILAFGHVILSLWLHCPVWTDSAFLDLLIHRRCNHKRSLCVATRGHCHSRHASAIDNNRRPFIQPSSRVLILYRMIEIYTEYGFYNNVSIIRLSTNVLYNNTVRLNSTRTCISLQVYHVSNRMKSVGRKANRNGKRSTVAITNSKQFACMSMKDIIESKEVDGKRILHSAHQIWNSIYIPTHWDLKLKEISNRLHSQIDASILYVCVCGCHANGSIVNDLFYQHHIIFRSSRSPRAPPSYRILLSGIINHMVSI